MAKDSVAMVEGFAAQVTTKAQAAPDTVRFAIKAGAAVAIYRSPDGAYARDFSLGNPPYECTAQEWQDYLSKDERFEEVK